MSESAQGASPANELYHHLAGLTQACTDLRTQYTHLEGRFQELASSIPAGPGLGHTIVSLPTEPEIPLPERFSGDRSKFRTFQSSCELYLALQPRAFASETTKVGLVISLLTGPPQIWAHRLMKQRAPEVQNLNRLFQAMASLYDDPYLVATAEAALRALRQGCRQAEDYAAEFRQWAADTAWNEAALSSQFRVGLSEVLKDELARIGVPQSLDAIINLSIQLDRRLRERQVEKLIDPPSVPPVSSDSPQGSPRTLQLGLSRRPLSSEERQRRRAQGLCLYCGDSGHYVNRCPAKTGMLKMPLTLGMPLQDYRTHLSVPLKLRLGGRVLHIRAIVDSGACSCFMDLSFAASHQVPLRPKAQGMTVRLADGTTIKSGMVTHESAPLPATVGNGHQEYLVLDAIASPLSPVILGLPWLRAHNPSINWVTGEVTFASTYCRQHCLQPAAEHPPSLLGLYPEVDPEARSLVPEMYHGFLDVFS